MGLLDALRDPRFRSDLATNAGQLGQSMSNTIAEGATVPVDALAWLLRKGGVNIPQNPIGGSDWAAQRGLMADVPAGAPKMAGETLGLLAPMAATKQGANALATALRQGGENLSKARTMNPQTGAIVWHGSPHKFDKFDASKIGTGEGAQAYGHGLYLAESPDVAMKYQPRDPKLEAKVMQRYAAAERLQNYPAMQVYEDFGLNRTPEEVLSSIKNAGYSPKDLKEAMNAYKVAAKDYTNQSTGALYKVDLPDDQIAKMLDWDKPLSEQTQLASAMPEFAAANKAIYGHSLDVSQPQADMAYTTLSEYLGGTNKAADLLRSRGIPGIRYLDAGSRDVGRGSSNFVVFPGNENMLQILERNGQPLGLLK